MALAEIFKRPAYYGFVVNEDQLYYPAQCDIVEVSGPVEDWPQWASQYDISYSQLREENPWIRDKKLTNKAGKTYKVRVPRKSDLYRSSNNYKQKN